MYKYALTMYWCWNLGLQSFLKSGGKGNIFETIKIFTIPLKPDKGDCKCSMQSYYCIVVFDIITVFTSYIVALY